MHVACARIGRRVRIVADEGTGLQIEGVHPSIDAHRNIADGNAGRHRDQIFRRLRLNRNIAGNQSCHAGADIGVGGFGVGANIHTDARRSRPAGGQIASHRDHRGVILRSHRQIAGGDGDLRTMPDKGRRRLIETIDRRRPRHADIAPHSNAGHDRQNIFARQRRHRQARSGGTHLIADTDIGLRRGGVLQGCIGRPNARRARHPDGADNHGGLEGVIG